MSGAKEVDQSGTNEMSTAAEVAGGYSLYVAAMQDELYRDQNLKAIEGFISSQQSNDIRKLKAKYYNTTNKQIEIKDKNVSYIGGRAPSHDANFKY